MRSLMITPLFLVIATEITWAESRFFNPQVEVGMFPRFYVNIDHRPAENWAVLGEGTTQSFVVSNRFKFYTDRTGMNFYIVPRFVVDRMPWKYNFYDFDLDVILPGKMNETHYGYGFELMLGNHPGGRLWTGASAGMDVTRGGWNHYYWALITKFRILKSIHLGVRAEIGKKSRVNMVFGL